MPVPLLDLSAQNKPLDSKLKAAFERVLDSNGFILGPEVEAFEREIADFLGVKHTLGVSSGTDALLLALMSHGIGPGDEVLCPTFTFFATAGCVARVGATPVFVDVDKKSFNIDTEDAATKITGKTKAIIPVHLYGQVANMDRVLTLASTHNLTVIEDTAQAIGALYKGKQAGTIGHSGIYSFFPSKNLSGFGDSGLFATNDDALFEKARLLRVHGAKNQYEHELIGGNFRIDPIQCALLREKLPLLPSYIEKRQQNAVFYNTYLKETCGSKLDEILVLPEAESPESHTWNQYTLRVLDKNRREALLKHLTDKEIGCRVYYPQTLGKQACFQNISWGEENNHKAQELCKEVISIPVYPELPEGQRALVAENLAYFIKSQ